MMEQLAEGVTLYCGDCREILPTLGKVDAVVTDPPYGMKYNTDSRRFSGGKYGNKRYGKGPNKRDIIGDEKEFDPTFWLSFPECILWGSNHYSHKLPLGTTLVWIKRYPHMFGSFLSDAEIGWLRGGSGVYAFNVPDSGGLRQKEYTGSAFGGKSAHPAQKPIGLMEWCIKLLDANIILDPFMGSGTTGVAAVKLGRKFIGIEIEPKYYDIARSRLTDALKQPALFIEAPKPVQLAYEY